MRAFVALWDEITRERYGVTDPAQRRFRYGVQVNSLGYLQRAEDTIDGSRAGTAARLVGRAAAAVQLPAWNEALGLPRPGDRSGRLRTEQVLADQLLPSTDDRSPAPRWSRRRSSGCSRGRAPRSGTVQRLAARSPVVESGDTQAAMV